MTLRREPTRETLRKKFSSTPVVSSKPAQTSAASNLNTADLKPVNKLGFKKLALPHGHYAQVRSLSDLYPQHERLKAAELQRVERLRVSTILAGEKISHEHELLAWLEMLSLRSKLSQSELLRHLVYQEIRTKLIRKFIPHAKKVALSYFRKLPYRPLAGLDDLRGDAYVGLANCVDVFDCNRYSPFESNDSFCKFSRIRIKGAIIDGLRTMQPFSRSISKLRREVGVLMVKLANQLGQQPTQSDFCNAYGEQWWDVLNNPLLHANVYNQSPSRSLQRGDSCSQNDDEAEGEGTCGQVEDAILASMQHLQCDSVDDLCANVLGGRDTMEYMIINYYFFWQSTLREIAQAFRNAGVRISIPQVNKIKGDALVKLRTVAGIREQLEAMNMKD